MIRPTELIDPDAVSAIVTHADKGIGFTLIAFIGQCAERVPRHVHTVAPGNNRGYRVILSHGTELFMPLQHGQPVVFAKKGIKGIGACLLHMTGNVYLSQGIDIEGANPVPPRCAELLGMVHAAIIPVVVADKGIDMTGTVLTGKGAGCAPRHTYTPPVSRVYRIHTVPAGRAELMGPHRVVIDIVLPDKGVLIPFPCLIRQHAEGVPHDVDARIITGNAGGSIIGITSELVIPEGIPR